MLNQAWVEWAGPRLQHNYFLGASAYVVIPLPKWSFVALRSRDMPFPFPHKHSVSPEG